MPQLPLAVWLAVTGAVALLLALCAGTAYSILRAAVRRRVAQWPARRVVMLAGAAAVPWLIVWLAPIGIEVAIHGVGALLAWLLAALVTFALLVLLPLAALLCAIVWGLARRRHTPPSPPNS